MAMLTSPYFVYRVELGEPTPGGASARSLTGAELASKLAYFLWNAPPDKTLLDLAESGGLKAPGAVAAQGGRPLAATTPRSAGLDAQFDSCIRFHHLSTVQKQPYMLITLTPALSTS